MKEVELKEEGFWFSVYTLTFSGIDLPKDTCAYYKMIILSIAVSLVLFPITFFRVIGRILYKYTTWFDFPTNESRGIKGMGSALLVAGVPSLIGGTMMSDVEWYEFSIYHLWWLWILGFVTFVSLILVCFGIVYGGGELCKHISRKYTNWRDSRRGKTLESSEESSEEIPEDGFKAVLRGWKDKYCSRIRWK